MIREKTLNKRERLFCRWYCATGNPREAAVRAGYTEAPEEKGLELLSKEHILKKLKGELECERELLRVKAIKGLERIAFGSVSDPVRLICDESITAAELERLDLFMISEIKKPKDGAMEIKFFDRLKALERLAQESDGSSDCAAPLYRALNDAAKAIKSTEVQEDEF